MAEQLTFAENDPVTGPPTVDGFAGWLDQTLDGVELALWPESDEPGYSNGGRATFGGGSLSPAVIQCVKGAGQNNLYLSFLVRFNQGDSPQTPDAPSPFSNDDAIILCLRPAFTPAVHDANTLRFDVYPLWDGVGADEPSPDPSVSAGTADDTLTVNETTFTNTWHVRSRHSPRHVDFYQGVSGGGWTAPTTALPAGVEIKVQSYKPVVPAGATPIGCWSVEVMLPISIPVAGGSVTLETMFGIYVNMVRVGIGQQPTAFEDYDYQTQYIWPQDTAVPLTDTLTGSAIDPSLYGQGYIPVFDSPPGNNTGKGVQFVQVSGVPGVGALLAGTSATTFPGDTIDPTKDNTLVAQVMNTDPTIAANDVQADFHFANWGLPPAQFPAWTEAQGAVPMPTAKAQGTIPAGGGMVPLTADWGVGNVPPAMAGTHQCVWVILTSDQQVQFVEDSVRRNMNFAMMSDHRATAEISGKGYGPAAARTNHQFVLVVSAYELRELSREVDDSTFAEMTSAPTPQIVWQWVTNGYIRTGHYLEINKRRYEGWLPAPGAFGVLAGHDDATHPFNSDLLAPGMKKLGHAVYELLVPYDGTVAVQTVLQAGPAEPVPATIEQGSTGPVVRQCQFLLSVEGYGIGPAQINGTFDASVKAVVERFQQAQQLTLDGVVGPATWAKLMALAPVQTSVFVPAFDPTAADLVMRLQATLSGAKKWFAAGSPSLAQSGNFDASTEAMVKAAQVWGAVAPSGTPDDQTWAISVGPTLWDLAGPSAPPMKDGPQATVKQGDSGDAVQIAQFLLSAEGFGLAPHQIDGSFGGPTHDAVIRFQQATHLATDGVVGPATWKLLLAHAPDPSQPYPSTLKQGAAGQVVKILQAALNQALSRFGTGLSALAVDGQYGPSTVERVQEFQRWGEVIVDGIVGYRTWSVAVGPSLWTQ